MQKQLAENKKENKKDGSKSSVILIAAFSIVIAALIALIISVLIYTKAEPEVILGDYKNMVVYVKESEGSAINGAAFGAVTVLEDEREKQAVLTELISISKFRHIKRAVDLRYDDFMKYYAQMAALYDEYEDVEALAKGYYGYEDLKSFKKDVKEYAKSSVMQELCLNEIARREKLSVTDEIFDRYIGNYLEAYDYKADEVDAFLENYGKADVYQVILDDYVLDLLTEWSDIRK